MPKLGIENHWLKGVRRVPSTNHDERTLAPAAIDLIVIHGISLPPNQFGGPYIEDFFSNRLDYSAHPYFQSITHLKVSSHLLIYRTGEVIQFVPFDQRAWHAGQSQFEGRSGCNDFSIGIELEGTDEGPYTEDQYQSLAEVCRDLLAAYPALAAERIVGHSDIAPGRKTDPGAFFDWIKFRELLEKKP